MLYAAFILLYFFNLIQLQKILKNKEAIHH